jgi:hypothetical protein
MNEVAAAGWYVCYFDDATRRTWHYFEENDVRSICGNASGYQRTIGDVVHAEAQNWYTREQCGKVCRSCMKRRLPIERTPF